jgi:hypothetical protein
MEGRPLSASAVEIDITPAVGTALEGYVARTDTSKGIHDPLLAQVLLLEAGSQKVCVVSLDLLGVGLEFTRRVRAGIEAAAGVRPGCTLIACTHTHSGPAGFVSDLPGLPLRPDPELQREVARKLQGAARWAHEALRPARLGVGRGRVDGIGANRNDPQAGPVDTEVVVLRLEDENGTPLAVLSNYGCHPTVLGAANLLFSADFPGAARAALRRLFPGTIFMHTNGASGDVSTRDTRRGQTFAEVQRMGHILAGEVLKVMETVTVHGEVELRGRIEPVTLPFRAYPSPDEADREVRQLQAALERLQAADAPHAEIRRAITRVEGAMAQRDMAQGLAGQSHRETEVQALRIGDLALVGLPGEPFTRTVAEIKARSPAPFTAVVGYANDETGYYPDRESVARGTYEAMVTPFGPEVAELLCDLALRLLREV